MSLIVCSARAKSFVDGCLRVQTRAAQWRSYCQNAAVATESSAQIYRTEVTDTCSLTEEHLGKFFTVDKKVASLLGEPINPKEELHDNILFGPTEWVQRNQVLGESSILVRAPALEILTCIRNTDLSNPAVRFILYGKKGCGKSLTLTHLLIHGYQQNFVIMPFLWIKKWITSHQEVAPSSFTPGRIDHIVNANLFLKNFRQANTDRLAGCVTHKEYVWSSRDKIQAGAPLMEVVDLGCDRLTFAADAMNVLIRELKLNCDANNCKLMVVVDGVNALFAEFTRVHKEKRIQERIEHKSWEDWTKQYAQVDDCTVLRNVKKLLNNDYRNAVIVTSVDTEAQMLVEHQPEVWWKEKERDMRPDTTSHLPFALLGQNGWSHMEPFVPVEVKKYSETELDSTIDYSIEKRWIRPEAAEHNRRKEIHFLSCRNPADFFNFSTFL